MIAKLIEWVFIVSVILTITVIIAIATWDEISPLSHKQENMFIHIWLVILIITIISGIVVLFNK
jgi:ABC-type iron transport system FetAB permease component